MLSVNLLNVNLYGSWIVPLHLTPVFLSLTEVKAPVKKKRGAKLKEKENEKQRKQEELEKRVSCTNWQVVGFLD